MKSGLGRAVNRLLAPFDLRIISRAGSDPWHRPGAPDILHSRLLPNATYSPWLSDAAFLACYEAIKHHTLVDIYRCYELWLIGTQLVRVEGDCLEVGVWRGGTGCLLAKSVESSGKTVVLADTFSGVVKAGMRDTAYVGGEHADASEEDVLALARRLSVGNILTLKGVFPDATGSAAPNRIALLHCDVDVYASARDLVDWTIPRLTPGALMLFDDYGFGDCEGVTRLVNELRAGGQFLFFYNLNGHAILINDRHPSKHAT